MSFIEPGNSAELSAHYAAVKARLLTPPVPKPKPVILVFMPPIEVVEPVVEAVLDPAAKRKLMLEELAAKWVRKDRVFFQGRVSPRAVIEMTAAYFVVKPGVITGNDRHAPTVRARHAAIYIVHKLCLGFSMGKWIPLSWTRISRIFNKDHATAIHGKDSAIRKMDNDKEYAKEIDEIIELLRR